MERRESSVSQLDNTSPVANAEPSNQFFSWWRARPTVMALTLLAVLGMGVAAYLTYVHLWGIEPICGGLSDCDIVNSSPYAEILGVPVALLGFLAYATLFGLSTVGLRSDWRFRSLVPEMIFGVALIGVLFSAYLTYVELNILHAVCIWCAVSAATLVCILVVSGINLKNRPVV